ncbi:MAG: WYL domain-containing protein, partial [Firmicutes bacterium]|nr:WYL domain-containing protein [Bacillota bacterium]
FYLCAYISVSEEMPDVPKRPFPTIYRIDRIADYEVLEEHFHLPYAERFEEGEFRKRIQFMFGGELRTIKFRYKGLSIEAVLDRFPTAEIIVSSETGYLIKAEVYGNGVDIWLRGQGELVEVIE